MLGVVLRPSLLAITTGSLPSMTATQELVVPRSIPIIFPIVVVISKSEYPGRVNDYANGVKGRKYDRVTGIDMAKHLNSRNWHCRRPAADLGLLLPTSVKNAVLESGIILHDHKEVV